MLQWGDHGQAHQGSVELLEHLGAWDTLVPLSVNSRDLGTWELGCKVKGLWQSWSTSPCPVSCSAFRISHIGSFSPDPDLHLHGGVLRAYVIVATEIYSRQVHTRNRHSRGCYIQTAAVTLCDGTFRVIVKVKRVSGCIVCLVFYQSNMPPGSRDHFCVS